MDCRTAQAEQWHIIGSRLQWLERSRNKWNKYTEDVKWVIKFTRVHLVIMMMMMMMNDEGHWQWRSCLVTHICAFGQLCWLLVLACVWVTDTRKWCRSSVAEVFNAVWQLVGWNKIAKSKCYTGEIPQQGCHLINHNRLTHSPIAAVWFQLLILFSYSYSYS